MVVIFVTNLNRHNIKNRSQTVDLHFEHLDSGSMCILRLLRRRGRSDSHGTVKRPLSRESNPPAIILRHTVFSSNCTAMIPSQTYSDY